MTETDPAFAVARAERARSILEDPMVAEALAAIRDGTRDMFFSLPAEAAAQREQLHLLDRARQHFEAIFRLHLQTGAIAQDVLLSERQAERALAGIHAMVKGR